MTVNLRVGQRYDVDSTLNIQVLETAGSKVKLGIAMPHGSHQAFDHRRRGYFVSSNGERWFVSWHSTNDRYPYRSKALLRVLGVEGNRVAVHLPELSENPAPFREEVFREERFREKTDVSGENASSLPTAVALAT